MARILKVLFFLLIVKPLVFIGLGLNILQRQNLPTQGPMVIAANHNSHLDTLVLMALFPLHLIHRVRPVAAADYFLVNPFVAWLSLNIIGIIPIRRSPSSSERDAVLQACHEALDQGDILIIFPEGSRGEPEIMSGLKKRHLSFSQKSPGACGITCGHAWFRARTTQRYGDVRTFQLRCGDR